MTRRDSEGRGYYASHLPIMQMSFNQDVGLCSRDYVEPKMLVKPPGLIQPLRQSS